MAASIQTVDGEPHWNLRARRNQAGQTFKLGTQTLIWGLLILLAITIGVLRHHSQQFHADGWMGQSAGVLLCFAIIDCLRRVFDPADLRPRRLWNAITAGILLLGFSFLGTSPKSFAENLALIGVCYLGLALLDVGLLLHLMPKAEPAAARR